MRRTNTCGELTGKDVDKEVVLMGWVNTSRDHGGIIFIDLRDRKGLTQIVFDPEVSKEAHKTGESLRREDVIAVKGKVRHRGEGLVNPDLKTGEIEVFVEEIDIITRAETPPMEIDDRKVPGEDVRLRYRYLDLRRPEMQRNLRFRHKVMMAAMEYFDREGFTFVETPMLVRATPEGARDYIVPSRVNPGKFYALPQSPQLYKQILMISGIGKYVQFARCLRDEDLRADRQPEHTQMDLEMSFVDEKDIMTTVENLYKHIFKKTLGVELDDFAVLTHKEAMEKYGNDKPDIRFGLELKNVSDIVKKSDFQVFKSVVDSGGIVKCINPNKEFSRNELDDLGEFCEKLGAKGMAWMRVTEKGVEASIAKYFSEELQNELINATGAKPGSTLLFIADKKKQANDILSRLRLELGKRLELVEDKFQFCWVVDFPLFSWNEEEEKWDAEHHIFSMPKKEHIKYLESDPGKVLGNLFDICLNGWELGSGSMRIHDPKLQEKVMKIIGLSKEEANKKFGFLLNAYRFGAPMHGGMGLGLDRLVSLMLGYTDIREVMAFPKNKAAQCPMDGSPSSVEPHQLRELHIRTEVVEQKPELFEKIVDALLEEKMEYEVIEHKPVYTSEEAAKIRGTKIEQGVKALICRAGGDFIQVCVPGNKEIDLKKTSKAIGMQVKLANADEVRTIAGCSIGAVPPFGNLFGLKVYVDEAVLENKQIAFNAGIHTKSIVMNSKDLVKLTGAKTGNFSK